MNRDGRSSEYSYDGLGRQLSTTETSDYGTSTTSNTFDGTQMVQQTGGNQGSVTMVRDALGDLALQGGNGETDWALLDRLGSTAAQSAGGSIDELSNFDDWGNQDFETIGWDAGLNFTGEQSDPGYGLNNYYSRSYDPTTGTWASQDSWRGLLEEPQSVARYAYVLNSPALWVDENGYKAKKPPKQMGGPGVYKPKGATKSPTRDDHDAAVKTGKPGDYYYSGGGSGSGNGADGSSETGKNNCGARSSQAKSPCNDESSNTKRHVRKPITKPIGGAQSGDERPPSMFDSPVKYTTKDENGRNVPIRESAIAKALNLHNLAPSVMNAAIRYPFSDEPGGGTSRIYKSEFVQTTCNIWGACTRGETIVVKVVVDYGLAPDGNMKGVITAHCQMPGKALKCPGWLGLPGF